MKRVEKKWEQETGFIWNHSLTPPWRPSANDISNYRRASKSSKQKSGFRSLVLGATPELRDLAAESQGEIIVADQSAHMIKQMASLMKKKPKGKKIVGDWLGLDLKPGSMNVIFGDLVLRLIPFSRQERFLKLMRSILADDAAMIMRIHLVNTSLKSIPADKIIRKIMENRGPGRVQRSNLLVSRLLDRYSHLKNFKLIKKAAFEAAKKYFKSSSLKEKEILEPVLSRLDPERGAVDFFPLTQAEAEKKLKKYFKIKKKFIANDHLESRFYPVYLLEKK